MGLLTFALNVTLDGCCDHREMIADDAMLRYYTRLMDEAGDMLWGRTTCEMMESAKIALVLIVPPMKLDQVECIDAHPFA